MAELVTVIMTVYNHAPYLRRAIESVIGQETVYPYKLVIHDDASTDKSVEIINEYREKYPSLIEVILQTENQLSKGKGRIAEALAPYRKGKYWAYCEGDDYWVDPEKIQQQVDYLEDNPDCVALYGNCIIVDNDGLPSRSLSARKGCYLLQDEKDYTLRDFATSGVFPGQTATRMVRGSLYLNAEKRKREALRNLAVNGDVQLLILALLSGRVHILPKIVAAHRVVFDFGDSWTARTANRNLLGENFRVGLELRKFCSDYGGCGYPNDWRLFRSAWKAMAFARSIPNDENNAQVDIIRSCFDKPWNMRLALLSWCFKGIPSMLSNRLRKLPQIRKTLSFHDSAMAREIASRSLQK